jgi:hypothetical protein
MWYLPSNSEGLSFPQEELQEGLSTFCDPSCVPQGDKEPHLIQQNEPNSLVCDLNLSKQQTDLLGSRQLQWNLQLKKQELPYSGRSMKNFPDIIECMTVFASGKM